MTVIKSSLNLSKLLFALPLALVMTGTTQLILPGVVRVQAQSQPSSSSQPLVTNWGAYEPDSSIGKPGRREGGGTRNPCFKGSITVTALIPLVKFQGKQLAYGTTFEASPTFFAYVPPAYVPLSEQENSSAEELSKSRQVEFLLQQQEENKEIYRATFTVPASAGIVSISLPTYENSPTLEVGKNYVWSVSLICDAETYKADPSDNSIKISGLGSIKRVNPEASLQMQLKEASPRERFLAYARKGIWYDALSTLAELRRANPNNPQLEADWREMLKSIQLDNITQEPIVPTDSPSQR